MQLQPPDYSLGNCNAVQFIDNPTDEFEIYVELVFVVLSAGIPFVSRATIENTEHREISEIVMYPTANQPINRRLSGDSPIPWIDLSDPCWCVDIRCEVQHHHK